MMNKIKYYNLLHIPTGYFCMIINKDNYPLYSHLLTVEVWTEKLNTRKYISYNTDYRNTKIVNFVFLKAQSYDWSDLILLNKYEFEIVECFL